MTKRLATLAAVLMLVVGFGTGSPADADDNKLTIYSAKFVCGDSNATDADDFVAVVPGDFRTAINIHNPNNRAVTVTKQVVLTEAGGCHVAEVTGQTPQSPFGSPTTETLDPFAAVEWDCAQLLDTIDVDEDECTATLFNTFAKGFLIIKGDADGTKKAAPLNVVAVYTTRGKDGNSITQNVEEVKGRVIEDESNAIADDHHEDGR